MDDTLQPLERGAPAYDTFHPGFPEEDTAPIQFLYPPLGDRFDMDFGGPAGRREDDGDSSSFGDVEATEMSIVSGGGNTVLQALASREAGYGMVPKEVGFAIGDEFIVTKEDAIIYKCSLGWRNSVTPDWNGDCHQSRLYALVKYALENPSDDPITLAGIGGAALFSLALDESKVSAEWATLVGRFETVPGAVESLLNARAAISLKSGGDTGTGAMTSLKHELIKLFPEYYLCWLCASRINDCTKRLRAKGLIVDKDRDKIFPVKTDSVWDILESDRYGMNDAGVSSLVELNEKRASGMRCQAIKYVIDRLCVLRDSLADHQIAETVFSPISGSLRDYFPMVVVETGLNVGLTYGNLENKDAMLALMLASCELEIIRGCAAMVKTLISKMSGVGDNELKFISIASVMLGYQIERALSKPSSSEYAPLVYSRISTTNLGSLAAVWLATNARCTYDKLLTAGDRETQAFNAYSRVCPFIQAVVMRSAQDAGGYSRPAMITCAQVREVFSQYALTLVQITPGHDEVGASKMISEIDQQIVTTLFYGALTSHSWQSTRESTYLSQLLTVDRGHVRGGNAEVMPMDEGQLEI